MIEYRYDEARSVVYVTVSGVLTDAEGLAWFGSFLEDMAKHRRVSGLVDMRGLDTFEISSETVRETDRMVQGNGAAFAGTRWAFVADQDVVFGMARMYELVRAGSSFEIRVFRSLEEGRRWIENRP